MSWLAALSSRVYLPAAGIAALAVVLVGIGWSDGWGGERFSGSLTSLRVVLVGPVALAIIGLFLVVERVWPAQPRPLFARGYRHDLLLTFMNATLVAPLVTALTLSFMAVVRAGLPWIVLPRIGAVPRWGVIAIIVVAIVAVIVLARSVRIVPQKRPSTCVTRSQPSCNSTPSERALSCAC